MRQNQILAAQGAELVVSNAPCEKTIGNAAPVSVVVFKMHEPRPRRAVGKFCRAPVEIGPYVFKSGIYSRAKFSFIRYAYQLIYPR